MALARRASGVLLALAAAAASCGKGATRTCGTATCDADLLCVHPAPPCPYCVEPDAGQCPVGSTPAHGNPVCLRYPSGCVQTPPLPPPFCASDVPIGCFPKCSPTLCGYDVECKPPTC